MKHKRVNPGNEAMRPRVFALMTELYHLHIRGKRIVRFSIVDRFRFVCYWRDTLDDAIELLKICRRLGFVEHYRIVGTMLRFKLTRKGAKHGKHITHNGRFLSQIWNQKLARQQDRMALVKPEVFNPERKTVARLELEKQLPPGFKMTTTKKKEVKQHAPAPAENAEKIRQLLAELPTAANPRKVRAMLRKLGHRGGRR